MYLQQNHYQQWPREGLLRHLTGKHGSDVTTACQNESEGDNDIGTENDSTHDHEAVVENYYVPADEDSATELDTLHVNFVGSPGPKHAPVPIQPPVFICFLHPSI
jgi:hypothetical protein